MINFIDLGIEMQKRVIDAHEQSLAAAQKVIDSVKPDSAVQQAMEDVTQANLAAWKKWLALWGWRK